MDRQVVLQVATPSQSASGEVTESWSTLASVWAEVRPVTGREAFAQSQRYAQVDTRFLLRWRSDVTPLNRITYDGRTYDIVGVLELGRRDGIEILATARAE